MADGDEADEKANPHYNNWPNAHAFDILHEERSPIELKVEGHIPEYAAGELIRTGFGPRSIDCGTKGTFKAHHWFDNFAQLHRFTISSPTAEQPDVRVHYQSRLISDGLIEKVRRDGSMKGVTFAAKYEPCKTFFQKVQTFFRPWLPAAQHAPNEVNVNVTVSVDHPGPLSSILPECKQRDGLCSTLCTKTDASAYQMLDPETLEPIGLARQTVLHPELMGPLSSAHAKADPETGDIYNYNLSFGRTGTYRIFTTSASTGDTHILATFYHAASYIHSLFLTEHFVVLCAWNSYFTAAGAHILIKQNILEAMAFDGSAPAKWFVVDRTPPEQGGRGVVATYESDPFFAFHSINAYEEMTTARDGSTVVDILADIPVYNSIDSLQKFYYQNLLSDSPNAEAYASQSWLDEQAPRLRRYRLSNIEGNSASAMADEMENEKAPAEALPAAPHRGAADVVFEASRQDTPELPTIHPHRLTKPYRYVYGVNDTGASTFLDTLVKYDTHTHETTRWFKQGHTPSEVIFVPNPAAIEEDDGILLAVILDGIGGESYLLCLDAKDLSELGKAHCGICIGFTLHGIHTGVYKRSTDDQRTITLHS